MPLSDYNGQDSFTIGGNSFNNRASSGTPIYERTGGDGGSGGGTSGAILDMEFIEFPNRQNVEVDTTTGRFLEIDFHKGGGGQNGRAFIDLSDLTVVRADDDGTSNSILQPGQSIDGSYRVISDNGGSSAFNLSVRTVATGKLQFYQSSGSTRSALLIRHA